MMQKRYALRNIAIALVLTHRDRCDRVDVLNNLIDYKASAYRSPANVDGMPHAQGAGDPVGASVVGTESIEAQRDAEQNRINAVEWALRYVCDYQKVEHEEAVREALLLYFEDKDASNAIIDTKTTITPQSFVMIRRNFIRQILKYLSLTY